MQGFTLVELIAVIVILGVIAATAVPRFVDLSQAAQQSSVEAIAGSLGSASALNYATALLNEADFPTENFQIMQNCGHAESLLDGGLPTGYLVEVAGGQTDSVDRFQRITCEVFSQSADTIRGSFILHGT